MLAEPHTHVLVGFPATPSATGAPDRFVQAHVRRLDAIERDVVRIALKLTRGDVAKACRDLEMGRSTMYRKYGDVITEVRAELSAIDAAEVAAQ